MKITTGGNCPVLMDRLWRNDPDRANPKCGAPPGPSSSPEAAGLPAPDQAESLEEISLSLAMTIEKQAVLRYYLLWRFEMIDSRKIELFCLRGFHAGSEVQDDSQ